MNGWRAASAADRYAYQKAKAVGRVDRRADELARALSQRVEREPCYNCAVPADRHDEHGCAQYRTRYYG